MIPFLSSVAVISLSGVMMPGPMFAVAVTRSYKSQFAGTKMALGHAIVEIPLMLLIYFGLATCCLNKNLTKIMHRGNL